MKPSKISKLTAAFVLLVTSIWVGAFLNHLGQSYLPDGHWAEGPMLSTAFLVSVVGIIATATMIGKALDW